VSLEQAAWLYNCMALYRHGFTAITLACTQAYFHLDNRITLGAYDALEASLSEATQDVSDGPGLTMLRVRHPSTRTNWNSSAASGHA